MKYNIIFEDVIVNSEKWFDLKLLKNEVFKDIPNYEGLYQISNYGRVKSLKIINDKNRHQKLKILKPALNKGGYYFLNLSNKSKRVHRLVAETFIPNHNNYICVNHIDGNKLNNKVDNLEWCTHSHNNKEAYRLGLKLKPNKIGKENKKSKVIIQYDLYGNKVNVFYGTGEIKRQLGFAPSNILKCCKGKLQTAYKYKWSFEK